MDEALQDRQPGVTATGITGLLTLTKTGTTARTVTFPDAAIVVAGSAAALNSGRVPFVTTGGLLTDSDTLTYSAAGGGGIVAANASSSFFISVSGAASFAKGFVFSTGGVGRWIFQSDATAESGGNAGSPFSLYARTDAGAAIDVPLNIVRAAGGAITLARPVTCTGTVTVPNGTAAAPGIRLTSEAHGLYRIGSASMGFACAGVAVGQFTGAGASYSAAFTLKHTDASLPAWYTSDMANGVIVFGGPAASGLSGGGQVRVYGDTHATKASYVEFTRGATVSAFFDGSGILTCNGTVTVPNGTAAAPGIRTTTYAHGLHSISATSVGIDVAGVLILSVGSTSSIFAATSAVTIANTTASTTTANGALIVSGGIGVGGSGYFGGNLSAAGGAVILGGKSTFSVYGGNTAAVGGIAASGWENLVFYTNTSGGASTLRGSFDNTGILTLTATTDATTTSDGSVRLSGGLSVAANKQIVAGGNIVLATAAAFIYLRGSASVDGSCRISSPASGEVSIEIRKSGVWEEVQAWV